MPESPVLEASRIYQAQLAARDAQALNRLIDAYKRAYARLADAVELLARDIAESQPTAGQLVRMARYKSLMAQAAQELQGFQALTRNEVERAGELGVNLGINHARGLISTAAVGTPQIAASFNALPSGAVKQLLGFLAPDGPLYARLGQLAPYTASLVSDAFVSGVAQGWNPTRTARLVQDAFGRGLTDALRFVRTAQLYSYREASRATYLANSDVVRGWQWSAEMGPRTCGSCLAMHGTTHPLSEPLSDHHNGRCAAIPLIIGRDDPIQAGAGEAWFKEQSEARQREILGKGKYEAYQGGKFEFGKLSTTRADDVYGDMRVEATLQELVGE